MKLFIGNTLAKILDKMGCTVIIGCKINGEVKCTRGDQYFYSNDFSEAKTLNDNGQEFDLPNGKFTLKSTFNEESNRYNEWYRKVINKKNK